MAAALLDRLNLPGSQLSVRDDDDDLPQPLRHLTPGLRMQALRVGDRGRNRNRPTPSGRIHARPFVTFHEARAAPPSRASNAFLTCASTDPPGRRPGGLAGAGWTGARPRP